MMNSIKRFLDKLPPWTLTIVCFLAICWLTLAPHPLPDNDIPLFPGADKIVHAIMFGGFALCIILDWHRQHGWPLKGWKAGVTAACVASAFGLVTEILQNEMHAGRSGDGWDLAADIAGAFIVAAVAAFYKRRLQRNGRC